MVIFQPLSSFIINLLLFSIIVAVIFLIKYLNPTISTTLRSKILKKLSPTFLCSKYHPLKPKSTLHQHLCHIP